MLGAVQLEYVSPIYLPHIIWYVNKKNPTEFFVLR